jgi:hypothetical protein
MPGTRVRPSAGPGVNLVPGIHVFLPFAAQSKTWMAGTSQDKPGHDGWNVTISRRWYYLSSQTSSKRQLL